MHSPLESSPYRCVELPGDVRCAKDEYAFGVAAHAVHLDEKFGFDASGGFGFAFASWSAEGVDFVDEDDAGFVLTGEIEELLDESVSALVLGSRQSHVLRLPF
jgi:hypothetical protein